MKLNRNRLHCQFNRNRRLRSRLNLDIFTLHHCALNRGCGGWVSSFIIVCYGCVSGEAISPSVCVKPRSAMSNPRPACGPAEGFVRPSLVFAVVKMSCILTTCPCFNNLEFDIFDAGGPQCHFITSVTIAVRIRTLSEY